MNVLLARPLDIAIRVAVAAGGGYALAWVVAGALAVTLPMAAAEGVLVGAFVGFAAHVGAVVWCFAAASAARAVGGLSLAAVPFGAVLLL